jgi:hypothetical protein
MQVDEDGNRVVIDFAAARRGRSGPRAGGSDAPGEAGGTEAAAPEIARAVDAATTPNPYARETIAGASESSIGDIPVIPLEPGPQEFGRDLDAEVYIPAEHDDRRRKKRRPERSRPKRTVTNPFGRIEKGEGPKGRAPIPKWHKVMMAVCSVAILAIGYWVFGTGSTKLPGWDQGVLVRTQVEFLDQILRLPYTPRTVTWQVLTDEEQTGYGGTRNRLIAVMEFTPEQAAELIAQAVPLAQPEGHQAIGTERWFPGTIDRLMSDIDSETTVYDASAFYDGVFQRGIMVRLGETGFIVAKLFDY